MSSETPIKPPPQLRALTLWRPWAALIVEGVKPIENRGWEPTFLSPGTWIAIHAGLKWDDDCLPFAARNGVAEEWFTPARRVKSAIVGVARYAGAVRESDDPWFVGDVGWVFDAAVAIEPVPCKGAQGLWFVRPADAALVRDRYREAVAQIPRPNEGASDA